MNPPKSTMNTSSGTKNATIILFWKRIGDFIRGAQTAFMVLLPPPSAAVSINNYESIANCFFLMYILPCFYDE